MNIELIDTDVSRTNTYYFPTDTDKDNFFSKSVYRTIETSYYPPYYTNRIKLSIEDFNIFSSVSFNYVRYLRISYSGKYYYYFIDSIDYVNEDVYELSIAMDTYMTFMNNITLDDICIQRKFIDRYNTDGSINRNYLRENVSSSIMKLSKRDIKSFITSNDATEGVIVFKCSDHLDKAETCLQTVFRYGALGKFVPTNFYYYALPYSQSIMSSNTFNVQQYTGSTWENIYSNKEFHMTLNYISSRPEVVEAYMIHGNVFRQFFSVIGTNIRLSAQAQKEGTIVPLNNTDIKTNGSDTVNTVVFLLGFKTHTLIANAFSFTEILQYEENKNKDTKFDKKYLPVLMDSNYYRVSFGDRNTQCTDLIEYRKSPSLTLYYEPHIDGTRFYQINTDDYYQSMVASDKFYLPLLRDEWLNYNAYNSAAIGCALGSYALSAFGFAYGTGKVLGRSPMSLEEEMMETYDYSQFLDNRYKAKNILNKAGVRRIGQYERAIQDAAQERSRATANASNRAVGSVGNLVGTAQQEYNAFLAPVGVRANYDVDSIFMGKAMEISFSLYCVEDIEQVAQYYHHNGYLVNEWLPERKTMKQLVDYISTRYYFNILKLSSCDIKGYSLTLTGDICDDLAIRLQSGLRIWNNSLDVTAFEDYTYDNVEVKYL